MTGAEHYDKAEQLLGDAVLFPEDDAVLAATAQVHATLALAAATVQDADWFDAARRQV
jgi:hypothetical protein